VLSQPYHLVERARGGCPNETLFLEIGPDVSFQKKVLFPVRNAFLKQTVCMCVFRMKLFRVIMQNPHVPFVAVSEAWKGLESGPLDPFSLQRGGDVFC